MDHFYEIMATYWTPCGDSDGYSDVAEAETGEAPVPKPFMPPPSEAAPSVTAVPKATGLGSPTASSGSSMMLPPPVPGKALNRGKSSVVLSVKAPPPPPPGSDLPPLPPRECHDTEKIRAMVKARADAIRLPS